MLHKLRQLLQWILAFCLTVVILGSVYQSANRLLGITAFAPIRQAEQTISEEQLLSLLLSAYYMGCEGQELKELLTEYGGEQLYYEVCRRFIREGGAENYIKELCFALNN